MTADRWTRAVREQVGLGRLLPLGGARDGAWITEAAAGAVLRRAAGAVAGVRLGRLRIGLVDPADVVEPVVAPPPSALSPGPLRLTADFTATAAEPLPTAADRLRAVLADAAGARLGLAVVEVDLRATALLDEEPPPASDQPPAAPRMLRSADAEEKRAARVAAAVPGVAEPEPGVRLAERSLPAASGGPADGLPRRHARVEIAVAAGHRAVEVAREVRRAVSEALPDHPTVAVLVTTVG
ncbi:nucleopolyhedrovirus P10 family protein [Streptomyces sp. NPDC091279]|uniref:nucleopolyhedrovirus P10 family protein n=1 Tax=unclassified Streptomyces TaxID=2593676 RepID=UPI0037FB2FB3